MELSRRQLIVWSAVTAGGLALGIKLLQRGREADVRFDPWAADEADGNELSAWIEIAENDTVTIRSPSPEIGNGAMTQVAMNVAEELACDWSRVRVEFCSIHRNHVESGVYNSGFLPFFGGHGTDPVRMTHALQLGASARERLKAAAAARWNVPVAEIEARASILTHGPSGRRLRYGEVAGEAARTSLPAEPAPKPQSEWTFLGKASPAKLHIPEVVTGRAVFGIDVKVPGMVHAALMQVPVHGGTLKSHRPEAVLGMPGVRAVVVIDPSKTKGTALEVKATWALDTSKVQSAVAVIADHYWQAKRALDALPVEWDAGAGAQWKTTEQIYAGARALLDSPTGSVLRQAGDVASVPRGTTVEHTYSTPYCENAALEPLNGVALVSGDEVEVWCPTHDKIGRTA